MPRIPLEIVGAAYADNTLPVSAQEAINWYPEIPETPAPRSRIVMKGAPGFTQFASIGAAGSRGLHQVSEVLYGVFGDTLHSIDAAGVSTARGTIAGQGRVDICDNRIAGGNQVVVVNGAQGYVWNTATSSFAQITDPDFLGADVCDFLDNLLIFNRHGTADIFSSELADATAYDALDIATKESRTDNVVTLKVHNNLLWVFGQRSCEVWENLGLSGFPLQRISGATFDIGAAGKFARAALNNRLYFLGHDGKAYVMNGYAPQRISTHAIEQAFATETLSECEMFAYSDRGHDFVVYRFPNGKAWVFDLAGGFWHSRKSYDVEGWRVNSYALAYGKHLVGDSRTGIIWEMRNDVYKEGSDPLIAERVTPVAHQNQNAVIWSELEVVLDAGHGLAAGQGSDPMLEFRYSDNFGRSWSNWRQVSAGLTGEYGRRARFTRLGMARNRVGHLRISDPVPRDILAATGDLTPLSR